MKFFIKIFGIAVVIIVLSASNAAENVQRDDYLGQNDLILLNENYKYELAIEDLAMLSNHELIKSNLSKKKKGLKQLESAPILTKRKSKFYASNYNGSFYKIYTLK